MISCVAILSIDRRRTAQCRQVAKFLSPQPLLFLGLIDCAARNFSTPKLSARQPVLIYPLSFQTVPHSLERTPGGGVYNPCLAAHQSLSVPACVFLARSRVYQLE